MVPIVRGHHEGTDSISPELERIFKEKQSWQPRDYRSVHIPRLGLVSPRFLLRWRVFRWVVNRFVYHQGLIY